MEYSVGKIKFGIDTIAFMFLPFLAVLGAWLSRRIKLAGGSWPIAFMMVTSLVSSVAWILISKHTKMSLAVATIVFDTIYGLAYFLAFLAMGEHATATQCIGVAMAMAGMALMSL